jgi:hypothetical protein
MQTSVRSLRTYLLAGRARLPALHRGSRQDFHIPAQLQAMLAGIGPGRHFTRPFRVPVQWKHPTPRP